MFPLTTIADKTTTNTVAARNPTTSYNIPAMEGPMKAPRAKVEVQSPDIKPYVSKLLANPCWLKKQKIKIHSILYHTHNGEQITINTQGSLFKQFFI